MNPTGTPIEALNAKIDSGFQFREVGPLRRKIENTIPELSHLDRERISIVKQGESALKRLPKGSIGLVLGSGPNSARWANKGWMTLDINPYSDAHFIADANQLQNTIPEAYMDYVVAEFIRIDPAGAEGVSPGALMAQANRMLKEKGIFIFQTASITSTESTIPEMTQMMEQLRRHGFMGVVELEDTVIADSGIDRRATYFCQKVRSGYRRDSGEVVNPIN